MNINKFRERLKERHIRRRPEEDSSDTEEQVLETELKLPIFIENNYVMNPIICLYLKLERDNMYLDKTEDDIVTEILQTFDQLINCCNSFIRPEFSKLHIISSFEFQLQEEEEATMNKMTFQSTKKENEFEDLMFGGLDRNIYSKYLGRIKMSKSEKDTKEIIFSKEEAHIFKKSSVKKYMQVADSTEE